jgi:hypothetical protein
MKSLSLEIPASHELFAHYLLDTGLRRYDDVDGF